MKKLLEKVKTWFYFHVNNPVIRKGEHGGFKWKFRSFWLDISSVSGNFKARFMADQHPYGYLLAGKDDNNIIGFCQVMYTLGQLLTTDQGFVNDVQNSINKYRKRLDKQAAGEVVEDAEEEKASLEFEKSVQEHVELPEKERRKVERDINGRFKKAVKKVETAQNLKEGKHE